MAEGLANHDIQTVAIIAGKPYSEWPKDLFIPPDALQILLESFTGPLDLLLYLIKRQNIDILDIPVAKITEQYMTYMQLMKSRQLELAADYLVMAALLAEIKSRMLLPVTCESDDEQEDDPRMVLVQRLKAYEQIKQAAMDLDALPRFERDVYAVELPTNSLPERNHPELTLSALVSAMKEVMRQQSHFQHHQIQREHLTVRERMAYILSQLQDNRILAFNQLYKVEENRLGVVVSLLAVLELSKQSLLTLLQADVFAPIYVKGVAQDG